MSLYFIFQHFQTFIIRHRHSAIDFFPQNHQQIVSLFYLKSNTLTHLNVSWDICACLYCECGPPPRSLHMVYCHPVGESVLHEPWGAGQDGMGWIELPRLTVSFSWVIFELLEYLSPPPPPLCTAFTIGAFAGKLSYDGQEIGGRGLTSSPSEDRLHPLTGCSARPRTRAFLGHCP